MSKWILTQFFLACLAGIIGLVLHSCNESSDQAKSAVKMQNSDTIAYTLSNHKIKTLQIRSGKVIVLEQNENVHIHKTEK